MSALALALGAGLLLGASGEPWQLVHEDDGVRIYNRAVPGSEVREIKAVLELAAPSARAWEVLRDTAGFKDFMPYLEEVRILRHEGPNVHYAYQVVNPPMVSRRDYVVKVTLEPQPERGVYVRRWETLSGEGPPPRDGLVRLQINEGSITLETLAAERTRLTYQLHTAPGGSVPAWMANRANKSSLPDLMAAIRKRVEGKGGR